MSSLVLALALGVLPQVQADAMVLDPVPAPSAQVPQDDEREEPDEDEPRARKRGHRAATSDERPSARSRSADGDDEDEEVPARGRGKGNSRGMTEGTAALLLAGIGGLTFAGSSFLLAFVPVIFYLPFLVPLLAGTIASVAVGGLSGYVTKRRMPILKTAAVLVAPKLVLAAAAVATPVTLAALFAVLAGTAVLVTTGDPRSVVFLAIYAAVYAAVGAYFFGGVILTALFVTNVFFAILSGIADTIGLWWLIRNSGRPLTDDDPAFNLDLWDVPAPGHGEE